MHGLNGWRAAWAFVAFFAGMALIVPFSMQHGWGMQGLFFGMVGGAVLAYGLPLSLKLFRKMLAQQGIGLKDWGQFMVGAGYDTPVSFVDSSLPHNDEPSTDLVPMYGTRSVEYSEGAETSSPVIYLEDEQGASDEEDTFPTGPRPSRPEQLYRLNLGSHTLDLETAYEQILISEHLTEGTGNLIYVLAEELANPRLRIPMLLVDFGGFHTLVPDQFSGYLFGSPDGKNTLPAELHERSFPLLDRLQAEELGGVLLRERLQVIFRFYSYSDPVEASALLLLILQGMRRWQLHLTQQQESPLPAIVILNQAHRLLPHHDAYSVAKNDPAMARLLRRNLLAHLKARGAYGMYLYLVTGQVSVMHRAALDTCGLWLIRQSPQAELQRLAEETGVPPEALRRIQPDQALLVDRLTRASFPITVRPSFSLHEPEAMPLILSTSMARSSMGERSVASTSSSPIQVGPGDRSVAEHGSEEPATGKLTPYPDKVLAYVCYLSAIGWLTPNAIRRVPDPLFDLATSLGLNPVRGRDLMNRNRALTLMGYVRGLSRDERAHYVAMARPYAPPQPPRPRGGDHTMGHDPPTKTIGWQLPSLAVLHPPDHIRSRQVSEETLEELRKTVLATLEEQRVEADVLRSDISVGPRVIRIGIRPRRYPELVSDGKGGRIPRLDGDGHVLYKKTKVAQITALEKDFKLALAAKTLRMQAPVPETDYAGIEIPNPVPSFVTFYEVCKSVIYQEAVRTSRLVIALGKDIAGRVRTGTIKPHLLLAGQTGSGKSVGINTIIGSVLMQATPEEVRLLMIDPKRVEFTKYGGIPHLLAPVITEVEQVKSLLERLILEMEQRYHLFSQVQVRHVEGYEKKRAAIPALDLKRLPIIVVIIDELADLMMSGPKGEMEALICRLAQKARAAGIHLVLGTQRPTVDVVTGNIKANMSVRIAYRVASGTDARTIMDEGGADLLLGQGDLLYLTPDAGGAERLQGAYLSDPEIDAIVAHWKSEKERMQTIGAWTGSTYALPEHAVQLSDPSDAATQGHDQRSAPHPTSSPVTTNGSDALLMQVIAELRHHDVVSVDMLKRGEYSQAIPGMGHARACELRDVLARQGLIGPYSGSSKGHPVIKHAQDHTQRDDGSSDECVKG